MQQNLCSYGKLRHSKASIPTKCLWLCWHSTGRVLDIWRLELRFFFLLRDHPKDSLGEAAEVCISSAFTAPCLPSVVLSVCLRSRKHLSEEQDKCSALMCVFSLGIVGFVPGELACRLRYLMVAWREVVQLFWLPQHDPH